MSTTRMISRLEQLRTTLTSKNDAANRWTQLLIRLGTAPHVLEVLLQKIWRESDSHLICTRRESNPGLGEFCLELLRAFDRFAASKSIVQLGALGTKSIVELAKL